MINDLFRTYKKIILLLLVLLCSVVSGSMAVGTNSVVRVK